MGLEEQFSKSNDLNIQKLYRTHLKGKFYMISIHLEKGSTKVRMMPEGTLKNDLFTDLYVLENLMGKFLLFWKLETN